MQPLISDGTMEEPDRSNHWAVKGILWLFCPLVAAVYFFQFDGAFQFSLPSVVETAKLERDFLLNPSSEYRSWGDHYIYRLVAGGISAGLAAFICGGLVGEKGRYAGLVGGIVISGVQAIPFIFPWVYKGPLNTGLLIVTIILGLISPVIGVFVGPIGEEFAKTRRTGFAGIPRAHFLWFWIPAYLYGAILIKPIANFLQYFYSSYSDIGGIISLILSVLPVFIYGAPLFIGLAIISGIMLSSLWGWVRQIIGSIVLIGGLVANYAFQIWLNS